MTQPLIGVTCSVYPKAISIPIAGAPEAYLQAIVRAGGVPVIIPPGLPQEALESLLSGLQGLLFTGGGDIDPARFNGMPHPEVYDVQPERDELEISLVQRAARGGLPYLGICRGLQVINVALGGTLYTHILDQHAGAREHSFVDPFPRNHLAHSVKVTSGTRLAEILGETTPRVNSLHHQGVETPAPGLRVSACAPDGLIEGLEQPNHPFGLAVQWHPEWLPEHKAQQRLFRAFVEAAQRGANEVKS